jgi:hypothetical protein
VAASLLIPKSGLAWVFPSQFPRCQPLVFETSRDTSNCMGEEKGIEGRDM